MTVRSILELLRRHLRLLVAGPIVGLLVGVALTVLTPTSYAAQCQVLVSVGGRNNLTDLNQGATYVERSIATFAASATSPYVLTPVADKLRLPVDAAALAQSVTATVPTDSTIVLITATQPTPDGSAQVANAVGEQLVAAIGRLAPGRDSGGAAVTGTIIESAAAPRSPSSPQVLRNLVLGLAAGLVLSIIAIIARDSLDTRLSTYRRLRRVTQAPILAVGPRSISSMLSVVGRQDAEAQAVRRLHSALIARGAVASGAHSLIVITTVDDEASCTRWGNLLADSIANAGLKVARVAGSPLPDRFPGSRYIRSVTFDSADAQELLGDGFAEALAALREDHDVVVLDASRLTGSMLGIRGVQAASHVLVAVDVPRTKEQDLREVLTLLDAQGAHLTGVLVSSPRSPASFADAQGAPHEHAPGDRVANA